MTGWWVASYVVLWAVVILTLVVVLVVLRQLGLIYVRTSGTFQLDEGPPVGAPFPIFEELDDRTGLPVRFPDREAASLLVFTTPDCSLCKEVLEATKLATRHRDVAVVVLSAGEKDENDELCGIARKLSFIVSLQRQRALGVQLIPYAIVASREGVVLSKGAVNGLGDLEEILDRAEAEQSVQSQTVVA
jgi:methylamine dehydrogenase accessory protein MauD